MSKAFEDYHQRLFDWHCRNFYRFDRELTPVELDYLTVCFRLPVSFEEVSPTGFRRFSYYTYSHRVTGSRVNSSRLAYGSLTQPEQAAKAATRVLNARGIELDSFYHSSSECQFGGLGWDFEANELRVYFRLESLDGLPTELHALKSQALEGNDLMVRSEALSALVFRGNEWHETKLYLYPEKQEGLPSYVYHRTWMITDRRGLLTQDDVKDTEACLSQINRLGRQIVQQYAGLNEPLDTIAFQDGNHFTLYFP